MSKLEPLVPVLKNTKECKLLGWQSLPHGELAKALDANKGGNVALRLDFYFVLDPDCPKAEEFCNDLDANGEIPATITYKTASDHTCRIFYPPPGKNHKSLKITGEMDLELRTGSGFLSVLPPSYLSMSKTGKPGKYEWRVGHSPDDIEPAEFPLEVYEKLKAMETAQRGEVPRDSRPANLDFTQGSRDNSIYSVAVALRKGGMSRADVEMAILNIAASCDPPVNDREAIRKVESAFKETPGEREIMADVKDWLSLQNAPFTLSELYREAGVVGQFSKSIRRTILRELITKEIIKSDSNRPGIYTKIDHSANKIDWKNADSNNHYQMRWPLGLENYVKMFPKNIAVVAGSTNAGKTALLLNLAYMNKLRYKVRYLSSEMGPEELKLRITLFGGNPDLWDPIDFYDRNTDFSALIDPDGFNIIDYLEISDNFYQIGGDIRQIYDKLRTGIAVIGLQKKQKENTGRGGDFTMEKSRLYVTMDYEDGVNKLKITKGKNWAGEKNPNNTEIQFTLFKGCDFRVIQVNEGWNK